MQVGAPDARGDVAGGLVDPALRPDDERQVLASEVRSQAALLLGAAYDAAGDGADAVLSASEAGCCGQAHGEEVVEALVVGLQPAHRLDERHEPLPCIV